MMRRIGVLVVIVLLFVGATIAFAWLEPSPQRIAGRALAIDGDSMRMGDERIRLLDIDAPEMNQPCKDVTGRDYGCGRMAFQALEAMVNQRSLNCETRGRDRYGRILAQCELVGGDLGTPFGDVGAQMVKEGMAVATTDRYQAEQVFARSARSGVWVGPFVDPSQWRRLQRAEEGRFNFLGWIRGIVAGQ